MRNAWKGGANQIVLEDHITEADARRFAGEADAEYVRQFNEQWEAEDNGD